MYFRVITSINNYIGDAMERCVRKVEHELDIHVERLDILRNPQAAILLTLITQKSAPLLYHRESLQTIHVPPTTTQDGTSASATRGKSADVTTIFKPTSVYIDIDKVRAWAKGRNLNIRGSGTSWEARGGRMSPPKVVSQESRAMEQEELLLEESMLTPLQRKGKQAIQERTQAKADEQRKMKQSRPKQQQQKK